MINIQTPPTKTMARFCFCCICPPKSVPRTITRVSFDLVEMLSLKFTVAEYKKPAAKILITTQDVFAQVLSGYGSNRRLTFCTSQRNGYCIKRFDPGV